MPLQRASVGLREPDGLAQRGLRGIEIVQSLVDRAQQHVRGHELRSAAIELLLDGYLRLGMNACAPIVLLADRHVGLDVFDGRAGLAHAGMIGDQDRARTIDGRVGGAKIPLRGADLRETDEDLLQFDLVRAGCPLANLERLLPRRAGLGQATLSEIDPGVGDVDVRDLGGISSGISLQNGFGELQQRNRLLKFLHVSDQRRRQRCRPPRELGRMGTLFTRHARNGVAHQPYRGRGIGLVHGLELFSQLRQGYRGCRRCRRCRRCRCRRGVAARRQHHGLGARSPQQDSSDQPIPDEGGSRVHGAARSISSRSTSSAGGAMPWRPRISRTPAGSGEGRSASIPGSPKDS